MALIKFTNPKTDEAYEALTEYNQWLEIPPDKKTDCNCQTYAGYLADITPCAADRYVKFGGNLIRRKETATGSQASAAAVIPPADKEEKKIDKK